LEGIMQGDVETYQEDGAWPSRIQGQAEPFATGGTKGEQVANGERNSYGNDPRNVPG
jgi:hypothetical protein